MQTLRHFTMKFLRPWSATAIFAALASAAFPLPSRAADAPATKPGTTEGAIPDYEIIRLGRGHNNRLCLAATIGGIKGLLMLDTGANGTALNESTYRRLLNAGNLPPGVPKTASINGARTAVAMAPDFHVGKSNLGTLPVRLVPNRFLYDQALDRSAASDRLYDGLLGEEILRHYNAVVDCGRLALYLNTGRPRKLSAGPAFVSAGWTRIPMTDAHNDFTVPCTINGHRFRLIVDTGAPFSAVNRHLLDGAHLESLDLPMLHSGLVGERAQESGLVTVNGMQIGAYMAPSIHLITTPESFTEFGGPQDESQDGAIAGLLGCDVLAANGAVVDVGNKVLYLKRTAVNTH